MMMGPGCWWGSNSFFGMPWIGMIIGIIFWLLVLYGVFVLISTIAKRGTRSDGKEESAMDILKKRYARGEIDAEEFARKKKDIES